MRMRLHKSMKPTLALLCVAGLLAGAASVEAQAATPKRSSSKSGASLHRTKSSRKSHRRERGQKVPAPDRISEIQKALAKDGSFTGTPNGKWDAATVEATKKFQGSHGLNPTGKLDAKTLQQLGLGSQTAGAAPPLAPVSSTATIAPAPTARRQQ